MNNNNKSIYIIYNNLTISTTFNLFSNDKIIKYDIKLNKNDFVIVEKTVNPKYYCDTTIIHPSGRFSCSDDSDSSFIYICSRIPDNSIFWITCKSLEFMSKIREEQNTEAMRVLFL